MDGGGYLVLIMREASLAAPCFLLLSWDFWLCDLV